MKTLNLKLATLPTFLALALTISANSNLHGRPISIAQATSLSGYVEIMSPDGILFPIRQPMQLGSHSGMKTRLNSHVDIKFSKYIAARLGPESLLTYLNGIQDMQLHSGVVLLKVSAKSKAAILSVRSITATVKGATIMASCMDRQFQIIVLQGSILMSTNEATPRVCQLDEGQMLYFDDRSPGLPEPTPVNLELLMRTSGLARDFL